MEQPDTLKPIKSEDALIEPTPVVLREIPIPTTIVNDGDLPVFVTNPPSQYEYKVSQLWSGWWGGWGKNGTINNRLNDQAKDGWRLIDSRSTFRFWWWFLPRPKILFIFERELK